MDQRPLLLELTRQFYEDCKLLAQANPTQQVDEDSCQAFNALLREIQSAYNAGPMIMQFKEMAPRNIKFKDAMIVSGQLFALVQCLTLANFPISTTRPAVRQTPQVSSYSAPSPSSSPATSSAAGANSSVNNETQEMPPKESGSGRFRFNITTPAATPPPMSYTPPPVKDRKQTGFLTEEETRFNFKDLH